MKRTQLKRAASLTRSPLARKRPFRTRATVRPPGPGSEAWKAPRAGFCECGCGRYSRRLHGHHVLLAQIVRREGADVWAPRNRMNVHPDCHASHHSGARKILIAMVPEDALAFAVDVLGEARAADYFRRRYAP